MRVWSRLLSLGEPALNLPELRVLERYNDHSRVVLDEMRSHHVSSGNELRILEAGCGREWPYRLDDLPIHLTGVDLDDVALEARRRKGDLDVCVNGDLREVDFPSASFDIIYSKFVLEHIKGAEAVLDRFMGWLKPGGLLILIFPDRDSVYGLFTRLTPFWFHVLFKKYGLGEKAAGQVGFGPYPTYSERVTGRTAFRQYCMNRNINIIAEYGMGDARMPELFRVIMRLFERASFGRFKANHNNLLYVLKVAAE